MCAIIYFKMPKRPRQHELESESRAAIRNIIPSRWVCRDLDQDYGIDCEIEIFDEDRNSTGSKFQVQLKATDQENLSIALKLRFSTSHVKYYQSLDLPLLVVLYHAPTDSLFTRWFHSFDSYYDKTTNKGVTFKLGKKING